MTDDEKDARIKLLEEQRRRWFNRAWRLHDAIEAVDPAWAARIVEGWEHDGDAERRNLRRCTPCGGVYPACDRVHVIRGDGAPIECTSPSEGDEHGR